MMKNKMIITLTFLMLLSLICVEAFAQDESYHQISGHTRPVNSVAFSPDGQTIVSGGGDGTILWNANTGAYMKTLQGSGYIAAFSPVSFGPVLAVIRRTGSGSNRTIRLFNADTGEPLKTLVGHRSGPQVLTYTGVWDLETTFEKQKYGLRAPSAKIMTLADYDPFQKLTPEAQQYLLQHFGNTATAETKNPNLLQIPTETSLLTNYPNPFNPETWIPYQLSKPAEVSLTIYDMNGRVVCDLDLGHQRAGIYRSRNRAAHWDGRNSLDEPVASGVYFYTLTTEQFSATRKMLILK